MLFALLSNIKYYLLSLFGKKETLSQLLPVFKGTIHLKSIKLDEFPLRKGHYVVTPSGIGEIHNIEFFDNKADTVYTVRIIKENIFLTYNQQSNALKRVIIKPSKFKRLDVEIKLSPLDYLHIPHYTKVKDIYTFKITKRGYAKMTNETKKTLAINYLFNTNKHSKYIIKTIYKMGYLIIKK